MKSKYIIIIFLLSTLLFLTSVHAYVLYCLTEGESLPPGCEDDPDIDCMYTCEHDLCQICTTDGGYPGVNPSHCNDFACTFLGEDGNDMEPPELTLISPINGETYGNKRVYVTLEVEPSARLEIKDNIHGGGWRILSNSDVTEYNRRKTFDEGINDVTIRAMRFNGHSDEENVVFYVDSRDPDIRKVYPYNEDYLNGEFSVEYTELNLDRVEFLYKGEEEGNWNVVEVPGCESGERVTCDIDVDLSPYEGQEVEYKFIVYDSANSDESGTYSGNVDTIAPIMTINTPFESGYDEKAVLFDLSSTEEVDFFYVDNNDERQRHKKLCNHVLTCNKEVRFRDGIWDINIYAVDPAENFDFENMVFFIDTKKPKVKKVLPRNGKWVNAEGSVSVEYDETNLNAISFFYGMGGDYNEIALENCPSGKKQTCSLNVDFSLYHGEEIDAYFVISDDYNSVSSRVVEWDVDTVIPQYVAGFDPASTTVDVDVVYFNLLATEDVDFLYKESDSDRYRNLCRNKDNCQKSKRFSSGSHTLDLMIIDDAENSHVEQFSFVI
ncbi:MAG: hypothetical protein ABIB47_00245 [Candidatus Woesearchaeota archaeon]